MWWWFPFQINISEGWVGVFGTLLGVLIGYWLDRKKREEDRKERRLERVMAIHSQFEGIGISVIRSAVNAMMFSLLMNFFSRKKKYLKDMKMDSGPEWENAGRKAHDNALAFKQENDTYGDFVSKCHTLMVEFEFYLKDGEKLDYKTWFKFSVNAFHFMKSLSNEEFKKVNQEEAASKIHTEYIGELRKLMIPITKKMKERIKELQEE